MSLKLNSSGGGSVTLQEPVTASDLTLNLPTSSGTVVLDGGSPTFSALTINGNNISAVNSMGFRNRIINGDMSIDQRNNGASLTAGNSSYFIDRWRTEVSGGGAYTVQQSTNAPAGFNNSALITVTTADASIAAGDFYDVQQFIEGFNVADLGWGTASAQAITLSFWVRSSVAGTFAGGLGNGAANRSYVFTYAISAANTWEYKTVTIPGDTSGTWVTNNGRGLALSYDLGNGSSYQATAGSWVGQYAVATSGSVKLISTLSATWQVTGVQLEAGTVATPFERIDYGRELAMCQRYLPAITGANLTYVGPSANASSTLAYITCNFNTTARVKPTGITASGGNIITVEAAGSSYVSSAIAISAVQSTNTGLLSVTISGAVAGQSGVAYMNGNASPSGSILFTGCEL